MFGTYLKIVATMLDRRGHELYVGSLLDAMPDPVGLQRRSNQIARFAPACWQAANMFLMSLRVWRDEPFVRATYGEGTLNSLESDLATLAESGSSGEIFWGHRQLAYQRAWQ